MTDSGTPTERYKQFLDGSRWKKVLADAVREAYGDIFVLKAKPTNSDLQMIAGKFKSTYNLSDTAADRAARTFLALLNLADHDTLYGAPKSEAAPVETDVLPPPAAQGGKITFDPSNGSSKAKSGSFDLNYNIQIHLPATKDIEIYNAIFKSLREHIIE